MSKRGADSPRVMLPVACLAQAAGGAAHLPRGRTQARVAKGSGRYASHAKDESVACGIASLSSGLSGWIGVWAVRRLRCLLDVPGGPGTHRAVRERLAMKRAGLRHSGTTPDADGAKAHTRSTAIT